MTLFSELRWAFQERRVVKEGSDVICWHSFFQQAAPDFVKTRFWEVPKMNTCLPCLSPQHFRQPLLAGQGHSHRLQLQEIRK